MEKNLISVLNRKAVISWAYLLLAIGVVLATTMWPNSPLYFYALKWTSSGYMNACYKNSISWLSVGLWLCAGLYIIHFLFGAIYFPWRYKQALKMDPKINNVREKNDHSIFRGLFAGVACATIGCFQLHNYFPVTNIIIAVSAWGLLHAGLALATRTNHLFTLTFLTVDLNILLPWEYPTKEGGGHTYDDIYFFLPVSEDEEVYGAKFIKEYAKDQKRQWDAEYFSEEEIKKIQDFSEKLAREVS